MSNRRTTPLAKPTIESHHCTVEVRLEKIGSVPFFRHLDNESLKKINELFSPHHFKSGNTVYHQGAKAAYLRIVVFGSLMLMHHTAEGKDILIDLLQPGEYFGTLPILGDNYYSETAYAHTDCCIVSIGQIEFESILQDHPDVAIALIKITIDRLKIARKKIQHLTTSPTEQRIATVLLSLAEKFGQKDNDAILIQIPLSRKNLADMTGSSTETASRIMSQFQQDGLVRTGRRWVAITNPTGLSRISNR